MDNDATVLRSVEGPGGRSLECPAGVKVDVWFRTNRPRAGSGSGYSTSPGLDLEALYGRFDGRPLNDQSREYIFVAVRH